jgi:hypothetical protein
MKKARLVKPLSCFALLALLALLPVSALPQSVADKTSPAKPTEPKPDKVEADELVAQRRTFAISQVISLADEARSYHDLALRPHVLARAADALWEADNNAARLLFRRAWDAAEAGDADAKIPKSGKADNPRFAILRRALGHDLRSEVIHLAANRDQALGEEFLKKLTEANERESTDAKNNSTKDNPYDSLLGTEADSKRLEVARNLLDDGQLERALEFAAPALRVVNQSSISFLSALRLKNQPAADQAFAFLLARSGADPASDANTVSGLSCYAFTPGSYLIYSTDGSPMWGQIGGTFPPPDLPVGLRNQFFRVAADILLRPLPVPGQDHTSSGRAGKYMVIKRLLPLFTRYTPELATPLHSQLASLAADVSPRAQTSDNLATWNLRPQPDSGEVLKTMQDKLDHAKFSKERDQIYQDAAIALSSSGDPHAQELAKEIEDSSLRDQVRRYVDFEMVQSAVRTNKPEEIVRLARTGQLAHVQRVWAYTEAARLMMKTARARALVLLDEGADEARRIEMSDPDLARGLFAVAIQLVTADPVHARELLSEAVKAANTAEEFTGEDTRVTCQLWTREGPKIKSVTAEGFGIVAVLKMLAKEDLYSSIDLARSFKKDAPRAVAILAIAGATLEK